MLALALALALAAPADTIPRQGLAARLGLGLTAGADLYVPLTPADPVNFAPGRTDGAGTNASMRLVLTGHAFHGVSASLTLYRYLVPRLQAPWDPDFVYSLRFRPERLDGLEVSYANYDANRLQPSDGEAVTRVDRGVFSVAFSPVVRPELGPVDSTFVVYPRIAYEVVPSYYDVQAAGFLDAKHRVGAGAQVFAFGGLFLGATAYVYPRPSRQQPWDSDFSYNFGYTRGWPASVTVQYANYSGTRFPWRDAAPGTGAFRNGILSIAVSRRF